MSQDPQAIIKLFTQDAVYIEKITNEKFIYHGRVGIRKYWKNQICTKQSNIEFIQFEDELVWDAERKVQKFN